jgi:branched-chain amino acid transport system ATP-binding protein
LTSRFDQVWRERDGLTDRRGTAAVPADTDAAGERAVLGVRDVTVRFGGITALDDVSVEVCRGEVLGVIGPNGAGKTTLFNVICGFVKPDEGTLRWRNEVVPRVRPEQLSQMGIARTLQGVGLFPRLTVLENVMVGATRFRRARLGSGLLGLPGSDKDERALRERAMASLERLECSHVASRLPLSLPYAVQKQVALARALAAEPDLLMLDEPAGGLDSKELSALAALIESLGDEIAVMLVDHHMDLVTSVCDRLTVLDFGRVIATGAPQEVKQDPKVQEAYLGREAEIDSSRAVGALDAGD